MYTGKTSLNLALALFGICLFTQCKTVEIPNPTLTKRVKFKEGKDDVFLNPSLVYLIDSVRIPRFVVRFPEVQTSIVKEDGYYNSNMYYELEKALVDNGFKVIDRTFFEKKSAQSVNLDQFADYVFEIVGYRTVKYYTGIVLHQRPAGKKGVRQSGMRHYYLGAELSSKIIDLKTGEIVGTMRTSYAPCTKGCKVKYDYYEILEENLTGEIEEEDDAIEVENPPVDIEMVRSLAARVSKHLRYER